MEESLGNSRGSRIVERSLEVRAVSEIGTGLGIFTFFISKKMVGNRRKGHLMSVFTLTPNPVQSPWARRFDGHRRDYLRYGDQGRFSKIVCSFDRWSHFLYHWINMLVAQSA